MPQFACSAFVTTDDVFLAACACNLNEADDLTRVEELIDVASDILYVLSGGRVTGRCQVQVWPITSYACYSATDRMSWVDADGVDSIPLRGPNTEIVEVTIDGVVLSSSEYGLIDGYKLFRRGTSWPTTNDVTKTDSETGTFTITYRFGRTPDWLTKQAAIELVCSMASETSSPALSRLRGIASANVQGVSVQTEDVDGVAQMGLVNVNRWLDIYAPLGAGSIGVYSPELTHGWRLVTVQGPSGS